MLPPRPVPEPRPRQRLSQRQQNKSPSACSAPMPARERDQVQKLYNVLTEAKKKSGETVSGNLDSFASFVQKKTEQIRKQYGCEAVEYTGRNAERQSETEGKSEKLVENSLQSSVFSRQRFHRANCRIVCLRKLYRKHLTSSPTRRSQRASSG